VKAWAQAPVPARATVAVAEVRAPVQDLAQAPVTAPRRAPVPGSATAAARAMALRRRERPPCRWNRGRSRHRRSMPRPPGSTARGLRGEGEMKKSWKDKARNGVEPPYVGVRLGYACNKSPRRGLPGRVPARLWPAPLLQVDAHDVELARQSGTSRLLDQACANTPPIRRPASQGLRGWARVACLSPAGRRRRWALRNRPPATAPAGRRWIGTRRPCRGGAGPRAPADRHRALWPVAGWTLASSCSVALTAQPWALKRRSTL
jgi:hypothetical protein